MKNYLLGRLKYYWMFYVVLSITATYFFIKNGCRRGLYFTRADLNKGTRLMTQVEKENLILEICATSYKVFKDELKK